MFITIGELRYVYNPKQLAHSDNQANGDVIQDTNKSIYFQMTVGMQLKNKEGKRPKNRLSNKFHFLILFNLIQFNRVDKKNLVNLLFPYSFWIGKRSQPTTICIGLRTKFKLSTEYKNNKNETF